MNKRKNPAALAGARPGSYTSFRKLNFISNSAWRAAYALEDYRQECAASHRLFREAVCCAGLLLLRIARGGA
jgi:hypothetical protein